MSELGPRFEAELERLDLSPGPALVAVSGGPDSLALLALLARSSAADRHQLTVAHIDHGIHPESAAVAGQVRAESLGYGLPVAIERLDLARGTSETKARDLRYLALRRIMDRTGSTITFLAHHRDDQVETLLMRFLHGSGPAGLVGMVARNGPWIRPLLGFSRAELAAHLTALGKAAWQDPANRDPDHLRSWLRHDVIPPLIDRLPHLPSHLLTGQRAQVEDREAWDHLVQQLDLELESSGGRVSVDGVRLAGYSSPVVRMLLRALGRRIDLSLGPAQLDRLQALLRQGHTGQSVDLKEGARGELTFGRLQLFWPAEHPSAQPVEIHQSEGRAYIGTWAVQWAPDSVPADPVERVAWTTWVSASAGLTVRTWREGDRIRPHGGVGSRLVVRCMQERRVSRSRRPEWPVLDSRGTVVWVPGVCRGEALVPEPGSLATRIDVSSS